MSNSRATVHIIGASGRTGVALCRSLLADMVPFIPVVRNREKWAASGIPAAPRIADLTDQVALSSALRDAGRIVCCAHARHTAAVLAASPSDARFVLLGSTRKFTRWPDEHGGGVLSGEAAFLASGRAGIMLHPTMIYGAQGEDNVQRLAALLRRLPVVPLPRGGKALVQPIHQDDVIGMIRVVLEQSRDAPQSIVIAGPAALPYADFVRAIALAAGLPSPRIIAVPGRLMLAAAKMLQFVKLLPTVRPAEVRRLLEDKAFDVSPMIAIYGSRPMPLAKGLARTFAASDNR